MSNTRKLAVLFAATVAASMMTGTSAFAETRHRDETKATERSFNDRSDNRQSNSTYRNNDRQSTSSSTYRNNDRAYNNSNNNRTYNSNGAYRNNASVQTRRSQSYNGRVSRVEHYNGGYRVWVGGAPYPFFVSPAYWARFPLRVGINVNLGGYWNPAGYYDVYNVGSYATAGSLHGVVESVDYRRGTLVMRDDVSGSFVTVAMRGNDPRFGNLRPGDAIDLTGAWNRAGVFDAYNVAGIRGGGYGGGYDPRDDGRGGY